MWRSKRASRSHNSGETHRGACVCVCVRFPLSIHPPRTDEASGLESERLVVSVAAAHRPACWLLRVESSLWGVFGGCSSTARAGQPARSSSPERALFPDSLLASAHPQADPAPNAAEGVTPGAHITPTMGPTRALAALFLTLLVFSLPATHVSTKHPRPLERTPPDRAECFFLYIWLLERVRCCCWSSRTLLVDAP